MKKFYQNPLTVVASYKGTSAFSLLILIVILIPLTSFSQAVKDVEVIVECTEYVGNGKYVAYFGYDNPNKDPISVPEENSTITYNYGQSKKLGITTFQKGRHNNVFTQEYNYDDKVIWDLVNPSGKQQTKVSDKNSSHCQKWSDIVPYYDPTTKVDEKIGSELTSLANRQGGSQSDSIYQIQGQSVLIDIIVNGESDINPVISFYNLNPLRISINDLIITTYFPINGLFDLNADDHVNFVRPVYPPLTEGTGLLTQGDSAQLSAQARYIYGLSGKDIRVGVISDSFNKLGDVLNPDELPPLSEIVLSDPISGLDWDLPWLGTDEGRAMMEIIHDVAPEAELAFRTGFISESDFAQAIYELADPTLGACDVIVDDITYITEPFYGHPSLTNSDGSPKTQGLVSKAVDAVVQQNIVYLASAGNYGADGYEGQFTPIDGLNSMIHKWSDSNIDPGLQKIDLVRGTYTLVLQWEDDWFSDNDPGDVSGAQYDFDIYMADADGNILFGFNRDNRFGDPIEVLPFDVVADVATGYLLIENATPIPTNAALEETGPRPGNGVPLKYIVFRNATSFTQELEQNTSTIVGHSANPNTISVAAARWNHITDETSVRYRTIERFSSRGAPAGSGLVSAGHPKITAPDGGRTSVTSFIDRDGDLSREFYGTSAAAPHAAAVVALMLEANERLNADIGNESLRYKNVLNTLTGDDGNGNYSNTDPLELLTPGGNVILEGGAGILNAENVFDGLISPKPRIISYSIVNENNEPGIPGQGILQIIVNGEYIEQIEGGESATIFLYDLYILDEDGVVVYDTEVEGPFELQGITITEPTGGNPYYVIKAPLPGFLGDGYYTITNPGIGTTNPNESDPQYFFENQKTIIISADLTGGVEAARKFGEINPFFSANDDYVEYLVDDTLNNNFQFIQFLDANRIPLPVDSTEKMQELVKELLVINTNGSDDPYDESDDTSTGWPNTIVSSYQMVPALIGGSSDPEFVKYNFQFENGQMNVFEMDVQVTVGDVNTTYGDPISVTHTFQIVDNVTTPPTVYDIIDYPNLSDPNQFTEFMNVFYDQDNPENVSDEIPIIVMDPFPWSERPRVWVDRPRAWVDGKSFYITENALAGDPLSERPRVWVDNFNNQKYFEIDPGLAETFVDYDELDDSEKTRGETTGGFQIPFYTDDSGENEYAFVDMKVVTDGIGYVEDPANTERPRVWVDRPRAWVDARLAWVDRPRAWVDARLAWVDRPRVWVDDADARAEEFDAVGETVLLMHKDDLLDETLEEVNIYPAVMISSLNADTEPGFIIPAAMANKNLRVTYLNGITNIGQKDLTVTLTPDIDNYPTLTASTLEYSKFKLGDNVNPPPYTVSLDGLAYPEETDIVSAQVRYGDPAEYVNFLCESYLDIGSYALFAAIDWGLDAEGNPIVLPSNYKIIPPAAATLTIDPKQIPLSFVSSSLDETYDGSAQELELSPIDKQDWPWEDDCALVLEEYIQLNYNGTNYDGVTYNSDTGPVDVGSYTVTASFTEENFTTMDNETVSGTINILERPLYIIADNTWKNEGDPDPPISFDDDPYSEDPPSGLVIDHRLEGQLTGDWLDLPGEYPYNTDGLLVFDASSQDVTGNYWIQLSPESGKFYINPSGGGTKNVNVFLHCVEDVNPTSEPGINGGYRYIAYFRYDNDNDVPVFVPIGPTNYIEGDENTYEDEAVPGYATGLTEVFYPSSQTAPELRQFSISFDGSTIVMNLNSKGSNKKSSSTSSANSEEGKCNQDESARIGDTTIETADAELTQDKFNLEAGSIVLFPNPASENLMISVVGEQLDVKDITLFDSQGKMHEVKASWNPSVNGVEVDISELKYGIYLIKINVNSEENILRFMKK